MVLLAPARSQIGDGMAIDPPKVTSHQGAKSLANEHLRARGSALVAMYARRVASHRAWVIAYRDSARPDEMLDGGGLVVTDEGDCYSVGSAPGEFERLMMRLDRWPTRTARSCGLDLEGPSNGL